MTKRLFVYGSLKKGFGNHALLEDSLFICKALTIQPLVLIDLGSFPAVLMEKGESQVSGEVYEVTDSVFESIEHLEGYPSFYNRTDIPVLLNPGTDGETVEAIPIYHLNRESGYGDRSQVVKDGIWQEHVYSKDRGYYHG